MALPVAVCDRCDSALEMGDLRCAICGQSAAVQVETRTVTEVEVLRCEACGASVRYDVEVQAPRCAYCDSIMHLEKLEDPVEQTEAFLPFTIDASQAAQALRRWLATLGRFRPSDLKSTARIESLRPIWWVAWVFDAKALISWTADSNYGSRRSDWAPHAGQAEMEFDDIMVSASRGLSEEETDALQPYYDISTARSEPEGPAGAAVEQFEVQRSFARRRVLSTIDELAAERVAQRHVPGSHYRNVRATSLLRALATRRLALPAYVLAYRHRDRLYRAIISGQRAYVAFGTAPYSVMKIAAVVLGIASLVAIVWLSVMYG
jgi:hypothetical protein